MTEFTTKVGHWAKLIKSETKMGLKSSKTIMLSNGPLAQPNHFKPTPLLFNSAPSSIAFTSPYRASSLLSLIVFLNLSFQPFSIALYFLMPLFGFQFLIFMYHFLFLFFSLFFRVQVYLSIHSGFNKKSNKLMSTQCGFDINLFSFLLKMYQNILILLKSCR